MAGNSESGDAGDLFWPGYVDAVTNLAINLLFVIAVMSIVVIGITLQIAQMTKKKAIEEAQPARPPARRKSKKVKPPKTPMPAPKTRW